MQFIDSSARLRIADGVTVQTAGLHVIVNVIDGVRARMLAPSAGVVLALADGTRDREEIVTETMRVFGTARDGDRAVIEDIVVQLVRAGVLVGESAERGDR